MKKLLALMLTALLLLSLTACGSTSSTEPSQAESAGFVPALDTSVKTTLYVVGGWGNFEALDQVALDFKDYYPNVDVVYSGLDNPTEDLKNLFSTGEEIDLFISDGWNSAKASCVDILENAEDLLQAGIDFSNINAELLKTGEYDGRQIMLPVYLQITGYMVNLDLLEKAGVDVPTDFASLASAAGQLTAAGYEKPIYIDHNLYSLAFAGYYLEQLVNGDDSHTALDKTLAQLDMLYDAGYLNTEGDTLEDSYNALILRFFEGDIPILFIPTAKFCGTAKREARSEAFTASPFRYEFVPMVFDEQGSAFVDQQASLYIGAYKNAKNLALANEFLRFLFTDAEMDVMRTVKKMPTSNLNNGLADFPYLSWEHLAFVNREHISGVTEEIVNSFLLYYEYGTDNSAVYDRLDYLEQNGIN